MWSALRSDQLSFPGTILRFQYLKRLSKSNNKKIPFRVNLFFRFHAFITWGYEHGNTIVLHKKLWSRDCTKKEKNDGSSQIKLCLEIFFFGFSEKTKQKDSYFSWVKYALLKDLETEIRIRRLKLKHCKNGPRETKRESLLQNPWIQERKRICQTNERGNGKVKKPAWIEKTIREKIEINQDSCGK